MRVVIVGGGSAGWISAVYMDRVLNGRAKTKRVSITVVESARIGRIGVGEATVPTLVNSLRQMDIREADFLRAVDATFKQGIRFEGWRAEEGHAYYHTFDRYQAGGRDFHGLRWAASDGKLPFAYYVSAQPALCDRFKAPRRPSDVEYTGAFNYAYHMDAEKFAGYLSQVGVERGITHKVNEVVEARCSSNRIDEVVLDSGERVSADYFIDCTGFSRLLISKLPHFKFIDLSSWLICDRAVALQIPYNEKSIPAIAPFTRATALSAGWMWSIGLRNRLGTGYVYSSTHISDDAAELELRRNQRANDSLHARRLKFEVGRLEQPWFGNCVAMGLSAGFIEPMESTGIYLIEYAIKAFCELLPLFGESRLISQRFNALMADRYEEIVDFVNAHYVLSDLRHTSFWKDATDAARVTPSLAEKLRLWEEKLPSASDFANNHQLFGYQNYEYCVYGMDWRPKAVATPGRTRLEPLPPVKRAFAQMLALLPQHNDYFLAPSDQPGALQLAQLIK